MVVFHECQSFSCPPYMSLWLSSWWLHHHSLRLDPFPLIPYLSVWFPKIKCAIIWFLSVLPWSFGCLCVGCLVSIRHFLVALRLLHFRICSSWSSFMILCPSIFQIFLIARASWLLHHMISFRPLLIFWLSSCRFFIRHLQYPSGFCTSLPNRAMIASVGIVPFLPSQFFVRLSVVRFPNVTDWLHFVMTSSYDFFCTSLIFWVASLSVVLSLRSFGYFLLILPWSSFRIPVLPSFASFSSCHVGDCTFAIFILELFYGLILPSIRLSVSLVVPSLPSITSAFGFIHLTIHFPSDITTTWTYPVIILFTTQINHRYATIFLELLLNI